MSVALAIPSHADVHATPARSAVAHGRPGLPAIEELIDGPAYRRHRNGGGLVAVTAYVGDGVFVGKDACVRDGAIVIGEGIIADRAVVAGFARISGRCNIGGDAWVGDFATLDGHITMRRHAMVGGVARLEGPVYLDTETRIFRGHLVGPIMVG